MEGIYQNNVNTLPSLRITRYENIFKLYTTEQSQYYYNLIQSIYLPDQIDEEYIYYQAISQKMPWTMVSFNAYKTIDLWWLICLVNKIYNPIKSPSQGTVIKLIKQEYVSTVLNEIRNALV